jgi:hypothetical protein
VHQLLGRPGGAGDDQQAARVAVEAVDEAGPLAAALGQGVEEPVDVAGRAGAALDGEPRGLVEREEVGLLVDHEGADEAGVLETRHPPDGTGGGLGRVRRGPLGQRGDADGLAGGEAGAGLDALAVDPELAGAEQLLEGAVGDDGEVLADPAVEPPALLLAPDLAGLDAAHDPSPSPLPAARSRRSASSRSRRRASSASAPSPAGA